MVGVIGVLREGAKVQHANYVCVAAWILWVGTQGLAGASQQSPSSMSVATNGDGVLKQAVNVMH